MGSFSELLFLYSKTKRMRGGEAWQEHQIREQKKPENYLILG
nr:MAG TPA: hypothetical protein [Caudoviricetes sp.]